MSIIVVVLQAGKKTFVKTLPRTCSPLVLYNTPTTENTSVEMIKKRRRRNQDLTFLLLYLKKNNFPASLPRGLAALECLMAFIFMALNKSNVGIRSIVSVAVIPSILFDPICVFLWLLSQKKHFSFLHRYSSISLSCCVYTV